MCARVQGPELRHGCAGGVGHSHIAAQVQNQKITGPLVFVRVYSGVLQSRMQLLNTTQGTKERPSKLLQMLADTHREVPSLSAGQIGAAVGLRGACTGGTVAADVGYARLALTWSMVQATRCASAGTPTRSCYQP